MPSKDIEMTHPRGEYAYLDEARNLYDKKDFQQALAVLDDGIHIFYQLLREEKDIYKKRYASRLVSLQGIIFYELNEHEKALRSFELAKFLDPYNIDSYFFSGLIYLNHFQRPGKAIKEFYYITQLRFAHKNAHYFLAKAYYQTRYYELAVESICDAARFGADDTVSTFIETLLTDTQCLASITKEQVVFLIKSLPPSRAEMMIDKCLEGKTELGHKMWKPRFFGACSENKGTLKVLKDYKISMINSRM
jgi:tetratricopeptide (TPR) repeat protein